jgi:hypothetical protein
MVGRMNDNYLTSAVVFAIALFLFGTALTLAAGMLAASGMFPEFTGRCAERMRRPVRCFFAGVGVVVGVVVFMGLAKNLGELGNLLMLVAGGGAVLAGVAGAAGLVERMAARSGAGVDGWVARRRAATVLALSWVIPVAGGFVLLPACLLMGLGAAVMSVRQRRVVEPPPVPASTLPPVPFAEVPVADPVVVAAVSAGISNGL